MEPEAIPQRKRLIFCTYPSVYSDIVLDALLRAPHIELTGVVLSTRVLHKRDASWYASWRMLRQSGWHYGVYLWVVTDLYALLRRLLSRAGLKRRLHKRGIPVWATRDLNEADGIAFIEGLQAEVLLTAHCNQLVKSPVLDGLGLQTLNVHPSLLPGLKGVDPAFYALLRHMPTTGVTVHVMAETFDSGDILAQQSTPIRPHESLFGLNCKLFKLGAMAVLQLLQQENYTATAQATTASESYDSWPTPAQVRELRQRRKLFRWRELWALVRRA